MTPARCPRCDRPLEYDPCLCDPIDWRARALAAEARLTDPTAFWSSLTPAQAWATAKVMPRMAGPWVERGKWVRPDAHGELAVYVRPSFDGPQWYWRAGDDCGLVDSPEAARAAADQALREAGWTLVDGEEVRDG
jgi:hypothetical protein